MESTLTNEYMYVVGTIILGCIVLRKKLNNYEGMCLCGGPQLPGDERVRDPVSYQQRVGKCGYDTANFSSVL